MKNDENLTAEEKIKKFDQIIKKMEFFYSDDLIGETDFEDIGEWLAIFLKYE